MNASETMKMFKILQSWLEGFTNLATERLDQIIAIAGILSALIMIPILIIYFPQIASRFIFAPIIVCVFCSISLLIRNKTLTSNDTLANNARISDKKILLLSNIVYLVLCLFNIVIIGTHTEIYSRPVGFFVICSLLVNLLLLEIIFLPEQRHYVTIILIKITLVAALLRVIPHFIYQGLLGIDPWWHQMFTLNIIGTGAIPGDYSYSAFPLMHLIVGQTMIVTGLDYKLSSILALDLLQIVAIIVIFLFGKLLYNNKVGLLSALVLSFADLLLSYGLVIVPMTLGVIFMTMIIYLIHKVIYEQKNKKIFVSITVLTFFAIILTHTLATMCTWVFLMTYLIIFIVANKIYNHKVSIPYPLTLLMLFTIVMYAWWAYATGHFFVQIENILDVGFMESGGGFSIQAQSNTFKGVSEVMLSELGFFLFVGLSLLGSIYMITKRFFINSAFSLAFSGYIILGFVFFSQIAGLLAFLPGRWYPALQTILAVPVAVGILLISTSLKNRFGKTLTISLLVICLSFFMITNPTTNMDTPIYSENVTARLGFYDSELKAIDTICSKVSIDTTLGIDQYPSYYLGYFKKVPSIDLSSHLVSNDVSDSNAELLIIRQEILTRPFGARDAGVTMISYDLLNELSFQQFSIVYDCQTIKGMTR